MPVKTAAKHAFEFHKRKYTLIQSISTVTATATSSISRFLAVVAYSNPTSDKIPSRSFTLICYCLNILQMQNDFLLFRLLCKQRPYFEKWGFQVFVLLWNTSQ